MKLDLKNLLMRLLGDVLDLRDYFTFIGLGCAFYGVAQINAASAWIVIGAAFFWLGVRR